MSTFPKLRGTGRDRSSIRARSSSARPRGSRCFLGAIPFSGVSNRKLVSNGAEVKLVFSEGDLLIMTTGSALQDGSIGDIVRVRNDDSGLTVSGAVQPDGSVQVSGG